MSLSRRGILAGAGGLALSGLARAASAETSAEAFGYGPLVADPEGLFDLPEGFSYTVVSRAGETMSDGLVTPGKADGMGCFALGADRVALVRNHELGRGGVDLSAFGPKGELASKIAADRIYDLDADGLPCPGGTTTLVYDLKARRLERCHLSLSGTLVNCAGGQTPRNTWLSCEETMETPGAHARKDHGWVFEVAADNPGLADPIPVVDMGRFRHEATATDPRTGVVYLTEDRDDGLFYRYLPNDPNRLLSGGRLQALAFVGEAAADTRNWDEKAWAQRAWSGVRWIELNGVTAPDDDLRKRGRKAGAAVFARGEGVHYAEGVLYFTCTTGGAKRLGQIFRYQPSPEEGRPGEADAPGRLQLFLEGTDSAAMNMPDNLTIAPWGHLVVCEDKSPVGKNALLGVTPEGRIYRLGLNPMASLTANSELAGACFSPDGSTLFVNIYFPGTTIAITGPWARFRA